MYSSVVPTPTIESVNFFLSSLFIPAIKVGIDMAPSTILLPKAPAVVPVISFIIRFEAIAFSEPLI